VAEAINAEKACYNVELVEHKGSRVLQEWMATKSPSAQKAQQAQVQRRGFNAARVDRLTADWLIGANSINRELRSDLDRLRARGRDLVKNNEFGHKFKKMATVNIVGPQGFMLQSRVMNGPDSPDKLASDAIENGFFDWARLGIAEISGRMSFNDLCDAVVGSMPSDGEFLVRMVRGAAARNRYGFALQLIDVDRIDTSFNQNPGTGRNAVIMGVEVDTYRRPVAFHIFTSHPAENGQRSRERVPAEEIIHGFITEHAEQMRGIPWMSSAILSLHHLGRFEESALLAARKGADTLGFFVSPNGEAPTIGASDGDGDPITVSVPGMYDTLPEGYDFKPYDSKYPDAILADFNKYFLRRISTGFNVSYNAMGNDLEGVSFSSIRSGTLEERDQWMTIQRWFIQCFLIPVFNAWLEMALLNGAIVLPNGSALPASRLDKFRAHTWQGRRWAWVDPRADIESARLAIKSGAMSPQMLAAQMGVDVDDVLADLRRFEEATADIGLIDYEVSNQKAEAEPSTDLP